MLCTSHRALQQIAEGLRAVLPYPLFVQGSAARATLVEQFAQAGDGVPSEPPVSGRAWT